MARNRPTLAPLTRAKTRPPAREKVNFSTWNRLGLREQGIFVGRVPLQHCIQMIERARRPRQGEEQFGIGKSDGGVVRFQIAPAF